MKHVHTHQALTGRVFILRVEGIQYPIECTEMQDVDGKLKESVYSSTDFSEIVEAIVPKSKKWLLTVSTQLGCGYKCKFCDVPLLKFKGNLSTSQIWEQLEFIFDQTPEVTTSEKVKVGFARMGEPAMNWRNVLAVIRGMKNWKAPEFRFLPCFNSILPDATFQGAKIEEIIAAVLDVKEHVYDGFLHFQISCNSTNEQQRRELFGGAKVLPLARVAEIFSSLAKPKQRTITLNFICGKGWELDVEVLKQFDPEVFAVKLINLNPTKRGFQTGLESYIDFKDAPLLHKKGDEIRKLGLNIITDVTTRCEADGNLCCGQLAQMHMQGKWNEC